ncbi:armadillo-type protein [Umbelopsis sp. AD052]|nr:armadillo-type protein [Umbelopsis sp. AD052]
MKPSFSPRYFETDTMPEERFQSFSRRESSPAISTSTRTDRSDEAYSSTWKRLQDDKNALLFNDFMFPQEHPAMSHSYGGSHGQNKLSNSTGNVHREAKLGEPRIAFDSQKLIGSRLGSSYSNPDLATTRRLNAMGKGYSQYHNHDSISDDNSHMVQCKPFQKYGTCHRLDTCPYFHNTDMLNNPLPNQVNNALLARNHMQATMLSNASAGYPGNVSFNSVHYQQLAALGNLAEMKQLAAMNATSPNIAAAFDMDTALLNAALNQYMQNRSSTTKPSNSLHNPKRSASSDQDANSFIGVSFEDVRADIYPLCKDQHGCRFFQRKLEEQIPMYRDAIFNAVYDHFVELMTDPFGNYLCQKLVEYCEDDQRMLIVEKVAPDIVTISLNMHGTRAIQKMIEFLNLPQQTRAIVNALNANVVTLIKDLNGNHVIQKCLNKMAPNDNQIIYNAVCNNCVEVATHRHGCCVLQRCIDHAVDNQRTQLVAEIVRHALTLVQDPFGNYVVQYVLDLGDSRYTDSMIKQFIGNVCALSVQKFSSNVIEKCIRVAEPDTRAALIDEMVNRLRLEKLLRDSYANYVVQTSLDYAEPRQRAQLVECIRPLLPAIRNTPYGKRIQSKIHREQQREQERHYVATSSYIGLNHPTFPFNNVQLSGLSNQNLHPHQVNNLPANMAFNNVFENQMGNTSMVGLHNVASAYQYM